MFFTLLFFLVLARAYEHAESRLMRHLLENQNYNKLIRPAKTLTEKVEVSFDLIISQLIGVVSDVELITCHINSRHPKFISFV